MTLLKNVILTVFWLLKYVVVTALAAIVVVFLLAGFTSFGSGIIAPWISAAISGPGRIITIANPGPLLTGELRIQSVSVADDKGTYANIDGIALDWSPLSLFALTFKADRLEIDSVSVERKPEIPQTEEATTESGSFSLPVKIDVGTINLPTITLDQGVLGRSLDLSVNGTVLADTDTINSQIAAARNDGVGGSLEADLVYSPADDRLKINGRFSEPSGGVLATLLRLPSTPSVELQVSGEGPLSNWTGDISGTVDGKRTVDIKATHQQANGGPHNITINGGGQLTTLLPPAFRSPFAGETSIDLAVGFSNEGRLTVEKAEITSNNLLISGSGILDPQGQNNLSLSLMGVGNPVDFRWPLGDDELAAAINGVELTAQGPASAVQLDLQASLQRLTVPQADLQNVTLSAKSSDFDLAERAGAVDVVISAQGGQFENASVQQAVVAPLTIRAPLTLAASGLTFQNLSIESQRFGANASGEYGFDSQQLDAQIKLAVSPKALPAAAGSRFSDNISVSTNVTYNQPNTVDVSNLAINSDLGSLAGTIGFEDGNLSADISGELRELAAFIDQATGSAEFSLSADGPVDALEADARITIEKAEYAGHILSNLDVKANGTLDTKAPTANASASGSFDGQPIELSADLQSENGRTTLPTFRAAVGPNEITGNLTFTPSFEPNGSFTFDFPQLDLLAALAGQSAEGDLAGSVKLTSQDGVMGANIQAQGSKIARDGTVVSKPVVSLDVTDLKALAANGSVKAESVASGTNTVSDIVLDISRASSSTGFDLEARYDNAPVKIEGSLEQGNQLSVDLRRLEAAPRGIALKLADPVTIDIANGGAAFENLTLKAGNGSLSASGNAGSALDINGRLDAVPATLINRFVPTLGAEGTITGTVTAKGEATNPVVGYSLRWSDAAIAQTRSTGLPALSIAADGQFADGKVTVNTDLSGVSGLAISGAGSVVVSGNTPLDLKVTGTLPFELLAGQLSGQGLVLNGSASVDMSISGSAGAPQISGAINTSGARLIDTRRNLAIEDLSGRISMSGTTASIESLTGRLSGGGTLTAGGTIDILSAGLPADLSVKLQDAAYADGTLFATSASGDLTVQGRLLASPTLSGRVRLDETNITVPERLPPSLQQLDVEHRNASAEVRQQMAKVEKTESHGSDSDIALDLQVSAPARIFVRGRGIDAELGGNLTIKGTASNPIVSGGFDLNRGRISILTRRLDFSSGTITFGGNLIPLLDMTATTTSGSTTIAINITGLADDPEISFSSSPALPQDEILAQLIFGQSMSKLSPLQIAQLADAASQLAGGGSTSLLDSLRSGLGVDNLDVSTDSEGNASVSAGKYLNDRTYLEFEQSGEGNSKAIINLDVGRGVKLRGEAGADGSSGAGIFYEREY